MTSPVNNLVLSLVAIFVFQVKSQHFTASNGYSLELDQWAIANGQTAALVDEQIKSNSMVIYAKSWCKYCQHVKRTLDASYPQFRFAYVDCDLQAGGEEVYRAASQKSGMNTVPQIWLCGKLVGGADKFDLLHDSRSLESSWNQCYTSVQRKKWLMFF